MSRRVRAEPDLNDETIERYARQIVVPGIGAAGQTQLLATTVAVFGHPLGIDTARAYLSAAGMRVVAGRAGEQLDCVVLADLCGPRYEREIPVCSIDTPIAWYEIRGAVLAGGLATRDTLPRFSSAPPHVETTENPGTIIAHRIGASDAAGLAVAAILGWVEPGERREMHLGSRVGRPSN